MPLFRPKNIPEITIMFDSGGTIRMEKEWTEQASLKTILRRDFLRLT